MTYILFLLLAFELRAEIMADAEPIAESQGPVQSTSPVCFEFSSHPPVSDRRISILAERHDGHVLIGIDPGDPWDAAEKAKVKHFEEISARTKVRRHIYLEGPGGPTGNNSDPDPDELKRMRYGAFLAAKKLNIPIHEENWRKLWSQGLWLEYTKIQILDYQGRGYHTFEIDNLVFHPPIGDERDPRGLIGFYGDLFKWMNANNISMSIVPKNLSPAQIRALTTSNLNRRFLATYAITEEGYDSELAEATREYKKLGIHLLRSADTTKYAVSTRAKPGCG